MRNHYRKTERVYRRKVSLARRILRFYGMVTSTMLGRDRAASGATLRWMKTRGELKVFSKGEKGPGGNATVYVEA